MRDFEKFKEELAGNKSFIVCFIVEFKILLFIIS